MTNALPKVKILNRKSISPLIDIEMPLQGVQVMVVIFLSNLRNTFFYKLLYIRKETNIESFIFVARK